MEEKTMVINEKKEKKPGKVKTYLADHPKAKKAVDTAKKVGIGFALGAATVLTFGAVSNKKAEDEFVDGITMDVDFVEVDPANSGNPTEE